MYKAKSNKELWAFLFNDFLLLTHAAKQFTSSGLDKLFSNKNNVQLKMYKPVNHTLLDQIKRFSFLCYFCYRMCHSIVFTFAPSLCSSMKSW